jgi:flavodoxin
MKAIIIYDSAYGNTEQIARSIASAIGSPQETSIFRAGEVDAEKIKAAELLIVGAPTNGGRPTQTMQNFLNQLNDKSLQGVKVAAFDTRMTSRLVGIFGYAAGKIADVLQKKGGSLVIAPEGFFVKASKGPLQEGELEKAAAWAKKIQAAD